MQSLSLPMTVDLKIAGHAIAEDVEVTAIIASTGRVEDVTISIPRYNIKDGKRVMRGWDDVSLTQRGTPLDLAVIEAVREQVATDTDIKGRIARGFYEMGYRPVRDSAPIQL